MIEEKITIVSVDPINIYGPNDEHLKIIREHFSNLQIVARGNDIMMKGSQGDIDLFEDKLNLFIAHYLKYNQLTENNILNLLGEGGKEVIESGVGDEVIVYGNNGSKIEARTVNQRKIVDAFSKNDMVFAIGPAGTGKTYTSVAMAVKAFKQKEVRKIILTRPAVEAGENLGFLPGDLNEKLDPYLQPLYDALRDMIPHAKLSNLMEKGIIQIAPLAFMRGRTLDEAFVILDEAQNTTVPQMKMFLTRMGKNAKFAITGDTSQIDLPHKQPSGLVEAISRLQNIEGVKIVKLNENDVVRHKLVKKIIKAFEK